MKKILFFFLVLLCFGCSDKVTTIKKSSSDSLTYLFFKDFDVKHYCVSFYDRNVSKNDGSEIIIARDNDKYYYEYKGAENRKIIQKDGFKYTISNSLKSYYKEESEYEDFALGILPSDISKFKTLGYKKGKARVYNFKYVFEEYSFSGYSVIYYYKGNDLIYIKSVFPSSSSLIKYDCNCKLNKKMFEISDSYSEISY